MTEEEAKTKVCPQTFGIPEIRTADGCGIREGGPWKCIGSACMMWRWVQYYEERPAGAHGYCGLAGKP